MSCTTCLSIGTYDICCESITIGTATPATEYIVRITDLSTKSEFYQTVTATEAGEIEIAPNQGQLAPNREYEARVYESGCNLTTPVNITANEEVVECVSFTFIRHA